MRMNCYLTWWEQFITTFVEWNFYPQCPSTFLSWQDMYKSACVGILFFWLWEVINRTYSTLSEEDYNILKIKVHEICIDSVPIKKNFAVIQHSTSGTSPRSPWIPYLLDLCWQLSWSCNSLGTKHLTLPYKAFLNVWRLLWLSFLLAFLFL